MSEPTIQEVLDANPECDDFEDVHHTKYTRKWFVTEVPTRLWVNATIPGLRPVQRDRLEELRELSKLVSADGWYKSKPTLRWAIAKIEAARENCKRQLERGSGYGHAEGCGCTHCTHARDFLKD